MQRDLAYSRLRLGHCGLTAYHVLKQGGQKQGGQRFSNGVSRFMSLVYAPCVAQSIQYMHDRLIAGANHRQVKSGVILRRVVSYQQTAMAPEPRIKT